MRKFEYGIGNFCVDGFVSLDESDLNLIRVIGKFGSSPCV